MKKVGVFFAACLLLVVIPIAISLFPTASNQGYYPKQPIPFSHKLHAGVHQIECMYCHTGAYHAKHAGVPGVGLCMNCHRVVKTDSPYIQQLTKAYEQKKPIEWIRVHKLPDYVYFPHKRHLKAGVKCEDCHGPISQMERVYQFGALTMGWCMNCHKGMTTPLEVLQAKYPDQENPHGLVAPIECSTCHQ